jgi:hypothetical protein
MAGGSKTADGGPAAPGGARLQHAAHSKERRGAAAAGARRRLGRCLKGDAAWESGVLTPQAAAPSRSPGLARHGHGAGPGWALAGLAAGPGRTGLGSQMRAGVG